MNARALEDAIRQFVCASYPQMEVRVETWSEDPCRLAIYFRDEKFSLLYPEQRYHYLSQLIPVDFQERELANSVWFELAPGEEPADLVYADDELISDITDLIMTILRKTDFFGTLDGVFTREVDPAVCSGDFRVAKSILISKGFVESEFFDIFHVLMAQDGYCDCEVLYNVARESEFSRRYWQNRPNDPKRKGH